MPHVFAGMLLDVEVNFEMILWNSLIYSSPV